MGGGDGCRYVGDDVSLGRVMAARRSLRRIFTVILVGLVLPESLVSCVLCFSYCYLHFSKIINLVEIYYVGELSFYGYILPHHGMKRTVETILHENESSDVSCRKIYFSYLTAHHKMFL